MLTSRVAALRTTETTEYPFEDSFLGVSRISELFRKRLGETRQGEGDKNTQAELS